MAGSNASLGILIALKGIDAALSVAQDLPAFQAQYAALKAKLVELTDAGRDPSDAEWQALDDSIAADLAAIDGAAASDA